jgi:hypothetical protein
MKTKIIILAVASVLFGLTACNKDENEASVSKLDASKSAKIKLGEPVLFKFDKAPEGSSVQWSVTPNKDVTITPTGKQASILFAKPGNYTVNATYGALKGTSDVSVQDSIYNPGGGGDPTYAPLTGDQVFITVSKVDSMGINGLSFQYITEKKYNCLNHTLLFNTILEGQNLKVDFNSVFIPNDDFCEAGEDYAKGGTSWYPIEEGSHAFEVVLDGKNYTGSFVKSGSTYTITWPYTSGVTISPLVIN